MVCCHWLFHPSAPVEQPQAEPQQPPAPSVQAPPAVTTSEAGADSLGASFQHARHTLRDVHSFRLGPSELVLRHSVDGGRSALSESEQQQRRTRAAARVTRCVAIGTDASGRKCVNQYVKVRKLAQGSYGKVVLYSCREDGNVYAIKVLSKSHLGRKYVSHGVTALTDAMREVCGENEICCLLFLSITSRRVADCWFRRRLNFSWCWTIRTLSAWWRYVCC